MYNSQNRYFQFHVIDRIPDSQIPDANAPNARLAFNFEAT